MTRICILALIGLPGMGKTHFSQWLLQLSVTVRPFNVIHLCYDDFFKFETLDSDFRAQRLEIFNLLESLIGALRTKTSLPTTLEDKVKCCISNSSDSFLIICDDNHYYRSMRYKLYQLCRSQSLAYAQVYFEGQLQLSVNRTSAREAKYRIPAQIISQMYERLEAPDTRHHRWEERTFVFDAQALKLTCDHIMPFLLSSFENIPTPLVNEAVRAPPLEATLIHQLDLMLRRRIKEILTTLTGEESKRSKALTLNEKRKQILDRCRAGSEPLADLNGWSAYIDLLN